MNNTGRKVVKGSKTSAPMVMTTNSAAKPAVSKPGDGKPPGAKPPGAKSATTSASISTGEPAMAAKARPTREEIAQRSYELFLARGATDGHDLEDWVKAERELGS